MLECLDVVSVSQLNQRIREVGRKRSSSPFTLKIVNCTISCAHAHVYKVHTGKTDGKVNKDFCSLSTDTERKRVAERKRNKRRLREEVSEIRYEEEIEKRGRYKHEKKG